MDYSVSTQTYVKLALHAAKYPAYAVCGLLLGTKMEVKFSISDAVPLFHHEAPLAPMLEVACAMVDAYCQRGQTMQIVGVYYAASGSLSSNSDNGLSHSAYKVADKVEQHCSRACVLVFNGQHLTSDVKPGLLLLLKDVKRGWTTNGNQLDVADGATKMLTQGLKQNVQKDIVDFEEHLEVPSKDWRNLHIVDLLKLHV